MIKYNRYTNWLGITLLVTVTVVACSTTSPAPKSEPAAKQAGPPPTFIPSNFVARIEHDKGNQQTLFSLPSHAVWVDSTIVEIKQAFEQQNNPNISPDLISDAEFISDNYIVVECHIETMFRDSSIAYDLSGLWNTSVYLQSPSGSKVYPLQHLLMTPAEEKQVGTLKQFNRTNVFVFAMEDIISRLPTLPDETSMIRLYLEDFDTTFYFEWMAQEPIALESLDPDAKPDITDVIRWRPTQTETVQVLKVRFSDLYGKLRALTRIHRN
ncbi:MAG: hypothetical protein VCC01_06180 [Candidatus Hydrogenedentota bacterium]